LNINFYHDVSSVEALHIYTSGPNYDFNNPMGYFDAVGYSWEEGYDIGDNMVEGLLLDFDCATQLDWMAYSLNGQDNRTILGDITIPAIEGPNTIQVFANKISQNRIEL
jgi:hypothetical protein